MSTQLFSLAGRTALVTGGNGGLGRAMAKGFLDAGAQVAVTGRDASKNAAIAEELGPNAAVFALDVRDPEQVQRIVDEVVERFGTLDILVNNAGISGVKSILDMPLQLWRDVLETHLTGAFLCAQAAGRVMTRQVDVGKASGGKIINIASMYSVFGPPNVAHYATAKTGMLGLTRALAVELSGHNIQVNAILPGFIETDINRDRLRQGLGPFVVRKTPARRLGVTEDMAGAAIFLASAASDFITGTSITVDGGYSIMDRFWDE